MPRPFERSPLATLSRQHDKAQIFGNRVHKAINALRLPPKRRRRLRALVGRGMPMGDMPLSDIVARRRASEILFEVMGELYDEVVHASDLVHHITFVDDIGITSDRIPHLRMRALRGKVDKAIRKMGLSGLVFLEVQPLLNWSPTGEGRTLMLNAHALCWGSTPPRTLGKITSALNKPGSWRCKLGAEPIQRRQLKDGLDDALRISSYMAKLPHDGKYRVPKGEDEWRLRPTLQGYPDRLALRIVEGLSHYSIHEAVFSVRKGRHIRAEWKRRLRDWHRDRLSAYDTGREFDIPSFWTRVHRSMAAHYQIPFKIE